MTEPTFVTLGPPGTCHQHAVERFVAFQGLPGATVRLVDDFEAGAELVCETPNGFLVQCSSHPDVNLITERYRHRLFVVDDFLFPAREMALVVRRDVERARSLAVVPAARGYVDLTAYAEVISASANPVVWQGLLDGEYDAGITILDFVAGHEDRFRVVERFGIVDTSWVVYGRERVGDGTVIGRRQPWLYGGDSAARPSSNGDYPGVTVGDGYAVGHLADLGDDYGFRKVRRALGVTAFGVNALVRRPGHRGSLHRHAAQQELYFVHRGALEMRFGDGSVHRIEEGGFARVDAATVRQLTTLSDDDQDVIYLCAGGAHGYVGRDGIPSTWPEDRFPEGSAP